MTPLAVAVGQIDSKAVLSAGWRLRWRVLLEPAVHQPSFPSDESRERSQAPDPGPCYEQSRGACEPGTRGYQKKGLFGLMQY